MCGIFSSAFSITLWNIPFGGLTPYDISVGIFRPLHAFIVKYFCDSPSSSTYKYAFVKSNFENFSSPCIFENNYSGVGCGYVSFLITGFTVRLQSDRPIWFWKNNY